MEEIRNKYIYLHRRKDTDEIFYIGQGIGKRAYNKYQRNYLWYEVVRHSCGFIVEIFMENLSTKEANLVEIELIKKLGRYIEGGLLCNVAQGGTLLRQVSLVPIYKYDLNGVYLRKYESIVEASLDTGCCSRKLSSHSKKGSHKIGNYLWFREYMGETINRYIKHDCTPINVFDINGVLLEKYDSISEASRALGVGASLISRIAKSKNSSYKRKYQFRYVGSDLPLADPLKLRFSSRPIVCFDRKDQKSSTFPTLLEASSYLKIDKRAIRKITSTGLYFKDRYLFEYVNII